MDKDTFERLMYLVGKAFRSVGDTLVEESLFEPTSGAVIENVTILPGVITEDRGGEVEVKPEPVEETVKKTAKKLKMDKPKPLRRPKPKVEEPEEEEEPKPKKKRSRPKKKKEEIPPPEPGTIEYFVTELAMRKDVTGVIKDFELPILVKGVSTKKLRQALIDCYNEGTFDPFADDDDEEDEDYDEEPEQYDDAEVADEQEMGSDPVDPSMVEELESLMAMNSDHPSIIEWKGEQKCDLKCTRCKPVLQRRCWAKFIE